MEPDQDDTSLVTWGELRNAIDLTVTFCSELSVYSVMGLSNNASLKDQEKKLAGLGRLLNALMKAEIVKGMPDE